MHNKNHHVGRFIGSLFLSAALSACALTPVTLAAAAPQDERVYDREHKDYHHWDDHENAAWHRFVAEQHWQDHEYAKATRKEQNAYWNWRHNHPD
jgi:hypothetical protein